MIGSNEMARLVFGFKIRYLRQSKRLSYQEVSKATGLSTSYLNDIEKGKKYPSPEKIEALSKVFEMPYDELVSLKTSKKLQPIVDLLSSDFFKLFPLDAFGFHPEKLVDVFAQSPERIGAFVNTIMKVSRSYQIGQEDFYRVALRSYQDIHNNYFPELEQAAREFRGRYLTTNRIDVSILTRILTEDLEVKVDRRQLGTLLELAAFRSYFSQTNRTLYLHPNLSEAQVRFALAKELGFQVLDLTNRPQETVLDQAVSFERLLANFQASYFAAALLMDEHQVVDDLKKLALAVEWRPELFGDLLAQYEVTPEMFLQRLTNVLPNHFGLDNLFFLKLQSTGDLLNFQVTKELHLSRLHNPYQNKVEEHLCQRWLSIGLIKRVGQSRKSVMIDAQVSTYWQTPNAYFCLTFAQPSSFDQPHASSVTLGLLMNEKLLASFNFLKDVKLSRKDVHTTCERCGIVDCDQRVAPPIKIVRSETQRKQARALEQLS